MNYPSEGGAVAGIAENPDFFLHFRLRLPLIRNYIKSGLFLDHSSINIVNEKMREKSVLRVATHTVVYSGGQRTKFLFI
jgi:hypothetical protein